MSSVFVPSAPAPAADGHELVRYRRYHVARGLTLSLLESILSQARAEHITGTILIDVSQGTPTVIRVEERQRIGPVDTFRRLPL